MKKRIMAGVLLLALVVVQLVACKEPPSSGGSTTDGKETGTQSTTTGGSDNPLDLLDLPEMDEEWEGRTLRVLGRDGQEQTQFTNFEIVADGSESDPVSEEVYKRNSRIEDKYGVKISQILNPNQNELITEASASGEDLYDVAFVSFNQSMFSLYTGGYFYDLKQVDHINLNKPWWDQNMNEGAEMFGHLFGAASDFSLRSKNRVYITVMNRDLAESVGIPDIPDMVRNNTWTIDAMIGFEKLVAKDLDGQGMSPLDDIWGMSQDSFHAPAYYFFGCGGDMVANENGEWVLNMYSDTADNIIEKVRQLTCDTSLAFTCMDAFEGVEFSWSLASDAFSAGRVLFCTSFPSGLEWMSSDCNFEYGVIPAPKYTEAQDKYYTVADSHTMLFGIPSTSTTPDFSGYMLEVLSCYSSENLVDAWYEVVCKNKRTYDEDSAEMLDIIFDGIIVDPGLVYGLGDLQTILQALSIDKEVNFASEYAGLEGSANEQIQAVKEMIESLYGKA